MFENTPTSELIKTREYTMTAHEAEYLRTNLRETAKRADLLEGPDGPKTPKGSVPAATKREIESLRQYVKDIYTQLKTAPPTPRTFCQAMRHLTRPLVKMNKAYDTAKAKFQERFENSPTYALEWNTADVISCEETAKYAHGIIQYTRRMLKEHGHTVETLVLVRDGIAEQRDEALRRAISGITNSTSSSPTHNVSAMFQQHGRIQFVSNTAWPLLSQSQDAIDANKVHLALNQEDK